MRIQLSEHFTYPKLIRFVLPSIVMMIFTSIYGVVDGLFVSNYVGKTPFAALNLIMPLLMVIGAIGFMIGTGGSAIVSRTLGEGSRAKANEYFSMLVYVTVVAGVVLAAAGLAFLRPIARFLGAEGAMLDYAVLYGAILIPSLPLFMLQNVFQSFLITAEKPKLGLYMTVGAGVTNIVLDYLFVAVFQWGLAGAAVATAVSQAVGGVGPLVYFLRENDSLLRLTRPKWNGRVLLKTCTNGSSELMTNVSASLVNMLYNFQLMRLAGEDGVAAFGVIMYVNFIFAAIFIGYAIGSAPLIGYHYGAGNAGELRNLYQKSLRFTGCAALALTASALILSRPLAGIFVGYDAGLLSMTTRGFRLYALSFLISGFNIFGSAFFTALGDGAVSAAISFFRTLVFQLAVVLVLPLILGLDGVWLAILLAELLALAVTAAFLAAKKKKYPYGEAAKS
ncbi:MATE family efflux transporter [Gehongia tenuis]|uniref:Multidrug export protein MepA n=1 Tax=Gehongia tenuis TaxID=2763655 RepID=A0A926D3H0_9FIRM|nr:MATE family efflux transporter [Gehongia tenuis]MBC8530623.1 MATE family efflux transporter [Gehongia tenuis]